MFYYSTVDICCAKNFPAFAFGLEALETLLAARSASSVRRDQEGASRASRTGSVPRFPVLANPYRCRYMAEFQKWKTVEITANAAPGMPHVVKMLRRHSQERAKRGVLPKPGVHLSMHVKAKIDEPSTNSLPKVHRSWMCGATHASVQRKAADSFCVWLMQCPQR